jgi:hypothetical protein
VAWTVDFHDAFAEEFQEWRRDVQRAAATQFVVLESLGPMLGRPHADTLKGSRHKNMKELRLSVGDGEWRIAYAFDPRRRAILLVGASKSGVAADRFYRRLIAVADGRFDKHLADLRGGKRR